MIRTGPGVRESRKLPVPVLILCAIFCICLYEQDYLPQWIEHHVRLGISQFVISIDNTGLELPQEEYFIPDEFKDIVTLVEYDEENIVNTPLNKKFQYIKSKPPPNNLKTPELVHDFVNYTIGTFKEKDLIKTEWVHLIAPDQYTCLEHYNSIPEYLGEVNENCIQAHVPWGYMPIYLGFNTPENFFDILKTDDKYVRFTGSRPQHYNSLVKTKHLKSMFSNSHICNTMNTKDTTQFMEGEYISLPGDVTLRDFNKLWARGHELASSSWHNDIKKLHMHNIHCTLRGFQDLLIKTCFWEASLDCKSVENYFVKLATYIKTENTDLKWLYKRKGQNLAEYQKNPNSLTSYSPDHNYNKIKFIDMKYKYPITTSYTDGYLYRNLKKNGVTKEEYIKWVEKVLVNMKIRDETKKDRLWFTPEDSD